MDLASLALVVSVIGAIISLLAYSHAKSIKSTGLRLELGKALNEIEIELRDLPALLELAGRSRERVYAMRGLLGSGAMEVWKRENSTGHDELKELQDSVPKREDFSRLSDAELEARIVAAHDFLVRARRLREKYQAALEEDDEHRREKRADMRQNPPGAGRGSGGVGH